MVNPIQLKILSWNIWYDGHFDKISEFLRSSEADIIGLQEVVPNDPARDVISYLKKLGYDSLFAPALTLKDGRIVGDAIFSKYTIMQNKTHVLSEEKKRIAVEADIRVENVTLRVFSVHLLHTHQRPSEIQDMQVNNLIRVLSNEKTLVMGDFNAMPDSPVIRKMCEVFIDSDLTLKPTWSVYPEGCPTCNPQAIDTRLDYIFTSKDMKTSSFNVEYSKGSDHLPISVLIDIK